MDSNTEEHIVFNQPRVFAERRDAVKILVDRLKYRMPVAIDAMDNRADQAFAAWPERIYIVGPGGRVLYKGGMGPFGFLPDEAGRKLAEVLGSVPARSGADRS
jgi:iodothyronine deiodinase-like protein